MGKFRRVKTYLATYTPPTENPLSRFPFVAMDGDLVGWTDEVRLGGMPYRNEIKAEMVRWAVVYP